MDSGRIGDERRLRAAVLAGDELAWLSWYDANAERLRAYVHWRCAGLPDLADEIIQETWLTAVRRIRHFQPADGPLIAWLRGIAANHLRNKLRLRNRRPAATAIDGDVADWRTEPESASELVTHALAALPPHYERALRCKYLDAMSVREMAEEFGGTPKAVESTLARARDAFKAAYQAAESVDG